MSYFRAISARAGGFAPNALAPANRSRSPIADFDQRLHQPVAPASLGALGAPGLGELEASDGSLDKLDGSAPIASSRTLDAANLTPGFESRHSAFTPSAPTGARDGTRASPLGPTPPSPNHDAVTFEPTSQPSVSLHLGNSRLDQVPLGNVPFEARAVGNAPDRYHDELTTKESLSLEREGVERAKLSPAPSAQAALSQALSSIEAWMRAPATSHTAEEGKPAVVAQPRPITPRVPASQPLQRGLEPRQGVYDASTPLPNLSSAPHLSIGRIDIEIVRPAVTAAPAKRPLEPARTPRRVSTSAAAAAPTSALSAKRNFGMRQR